MKLNMFFNPKARAQLEQLESEMASTWANVVVTAYNEAWLGLPGPEKQLAVSHRLSTVYSSLFFNQFRTDEDFETWLRNANPGKFTAEATYLNEYRALRNGTPSPVLALEKTIRPDQIDEVETEYHRTFLTPYHNFTRSLVPA